MIVFLHGGVARWGKITSLDILEMCHWASQGVAVLAPTYRGEMGSEGRPNLGAGEVADVLHAVKAVEGIESIDSSRAVLWGFSRGGATAYRVLAASERFRAAVILAGPTDRIGDPRREEFHTHVYPGIVDDYESDPDSALGAISAIQWPERLARGTSLTLLHGDADRRVPVRDSQRMADALRSIGRSVELLVVPDAGHSLRERWPWVRRRVGKVLERALGRRAGRNPTTRTQGEGATPDHSEAKP
ncbi:MAG: prolyl oligopeptidase family serine peptidase [Myxococcota bacterium]